MLEHIDGTTLREAQTVLADRERFFARLLATVQAMHAAGVAHGDLKRKENTLVGPDETPYLIDFGIAALGSASAGVLKRKRFATTRQMDLNAWIKLKYGPFTDDLSAAEAALHRPLLVERWARRARKPWKVISMRAMRKRRREGREQ